MSRFLSERFAALKAYVPGEQPGDTEYIKLNTNESPYPPPPRVVEAVCRAEIERLRLYPNPDGVRLIKKLAAYYGIGTENLIIGNGSDELLAFAFLAFCDSGRGVAFPDITYGFYSVYADLFEIPYELIPLKDDFSIDPVDYFNMQKNIVLANPNAPTGIALTVNEIESIAQKNPDYILLIDEAYVDFGAETAIPLTQEYDNLLVLHTYSKSRSMAGARLAYAIGSAPLIEDLQRMKYSFNPYNVSRLTQLMGEAALDEQAYYEKMRLEIVNTREFAETQLKRLGFTMTNSSANFIFVRHPSSSGFDLYSALKKRGILVRHFNKPRIFDFVRITIGTMAQMEALISALESILA